MSPRLSPTDFLFILSIASPRLVPLLAMRLRESKELLLIFAAGLAIRETIAPFTGHPFDFELWLRLGYYTFLGHDPYTSTNPIPALSFPGARRFKTTLVLSSVAADNGSSLDIDLGQARRQRNSPVCDSGFMTILAVA